MRKNIAKVLKDHGIETEADRVRFNQLIKDLVTEYDCQHGKLGAIDDYAEVDYLGREFGHYVGSLTTEEYNYWENRIDKLGIQRLGNICKSGKGWGYYYGDE